MEGGTGANLVYIPCPTIRGTGASRVYIPCPPKRGGGGGGSQSSLHSMSYYKGDWSQSSLHSVSYCKGDWSQSSLLSVSYCNDFTRSILCFLSEAFHLLFYFFFFIYFGQTNPWVSLKPNRNGKWRRSWWCDAHCYTTYLLWSAWFKVLMNVQASCLHLHIINNVTSWLFTNKHIYAYI